MRKHQWVPVHAHTNPLNGGALVRPDTDGGGSVSDSGGGGTTGTATLTVQDEGVALAVAADTLNFVGSGVVASGTTNVKTITITSGATASDSQIWRPAMVLDPTSGNYLPMTTGAGDAVMVFA